MAIGLSLTPAAHELNAVAARIKDLNDASGHMSRSEQMEIQRKMGEVHRVLVDNGFAWPADRELQSALIDRPTTPKSMLDIIQTINEKLHTSNNQSVRLGAVEYLKSLITTPGLTEREQMVVVAVLGDSRALDMVGPVRDTAHQIVARALASNDDTIRQKIAPDIAKMQDGHELNVFNQAKLLELVLQPGNQTNPNNTMDAVRSLVSPDQYPRYSKQLLELKLPQGLLMQTKE